MGPPVDRDILQPQLLHLLQALAFALLPRALLLTGTFTRTPQAASDHRAYGWGGWG